MTTSEIAGVIDRLHSEQCSCVIVDNGGNVTVCHRRGIADLLRILHESPEILDGAFVADKVVGKGAAALMLLGHVSGIYADIISEPALQLIKANGNRPVSYLKCVPNISNRDKSGICPVENLCSECSTPEECLPIIEQFANRLKTT